MARLVGMRSIIYRYQRRWSLAPVTPGTKPSDTSPSVPTVKPPLANESAQ